MVALTGKYQVPSIKYQTNTNVRNSNDQNYDFSLFFTGLEFWSLYFVV